jgi:hypothetical protein
MVLFKLRFVLESGAELVLEALPPTEIPELAEWKAAGYLRLEEQLPYRLDLAPEVSRTGYVVWQQSQILIDHGLSEDLWRGARMSWLVEDFKTKEAFHFPISNPSAHPTVGEPTATPATGNKKGPSQHG